MSEHVPIDGLPLFARREDPDTSWQAAKSMKGVAGYQRQMIIAHLTERPMTADELDEAIGWRATTAGRRLKELEKLGLTERTGQTRATRSGRQAEVWQRRKE